MPATKKKTRQKRKRIRAKRLSHQKKDRTKWLR